MEKRFKSIKPKEFDFTYKIRKNKKIGKGVRVVTVCSFYKNILNIFIGDLKKKLMTNKTGTICRLF